VKFRPDPSFRYTSSFNTDVRKTFARIRESLRQEPGKASYAPGRFASIVSERALAGTPEQRESRSRKR